MATLYSSLYGEAPSSGAMIYRGASGPMMKGGMYAVQGTLTIDDTLTVGDVAKLLEVPEGSRLLSIDILPSADLDAGATFTFNLGWASAANTFASASAALQGTAAFSLASAATISSESATGGDVLQLTGVAGTLSAGDLSFVAVLAS